MGFVLFAGSAQIAMSQLTPRLDDPPPAKPPTKQDITKQKAISIAIAALKSCGMSSTQKPNAIFSYPRFGMTSGTWQVNFGREIFLGIHGRTGTVLEIESRAALDRVSLVRMRNRGKGNVVRPVFDPLKPPVQFLLTPKSKLVITNKATQYNVDTTGWKAMAHLRELPNGLPIVNAENQVEFVFDPTNGKLLSFSRRCVYQVPSATPSVPAARAINLAKASTKQLRRGPKLNRSGKPELGYVANQGRSGPQMDGKLALAWIVPLPDKEIWVNAMTGGILGGTDLRPRR
jgi:hypothetical protein